MIRVTQVRHRPLRNPQAPHQIFIPTTSGASTRDSRPGPSPFRGLSPEWLGGFSRFSLHRGA